MTNSSCQFGWEQNGSGNEATQLCSHSSEAKQYLIINLFYMKKYPAGDEWNIFIAG